MKFSQLKWAVGRKLVVGVPYLWLLLFFLIPFIIVLKISFSEAVMAKPPFTDLLYLDGDMLKISLNLFNYIDLYEYDLYLRGYISSVKIAGIATMLCLLVGYPIAYVIAKLPAHSRNLALMLVILPSWTSFLIRIYAWIGLLKNNGLINNLLMSIGIIDEPLIILHTPIAVYIGIVYAYLPFMILPIYTNLVKHDNRLLEAASDLGASPLVAFFKITLPLSIGGIIAGSMLVFIPAVGEFVIPELLGGPDTLMIGKLLWSEFFNARNWPGASAVAVVMLVLLIIPMTLFQRYQARDFEEAGVGGDTK
ncbi:ABC transporter permease subunit [Oceanicoccus sp. KOV_DT_Chl]|uniref:ABC transporter permease subunit n=1 Tax=Oceanicoccus sp. KOV_DT_Chl TaxID=1904639 RepID=UPI000C7C448E|nr:ABC transporter permease subunit [Oceanicoccus sp. KOV_DT_Chl]